MQQVAKNFFKWLGVGVLLQGCTAAGPLGGFYTAQLLKATGTMTAVNMQAVSGVPKDTIYHARQPISEVCIQYNPLVQMVDIVPALQLALRANQIESRVYEEGAVVGSKCAYWLRYNAQVAWDKPPFADAYQTYVSAAGLTLQTDAGQILSSSNYSVESYYGLSKWASTHDKLAPVVSALVSGSPPPRRGLFIRRDAS